MQYSSMQHNQLFILLYTVVALQSIMHYPSPSFKKTPEDLLILTLLECSKEIALFLRHSPIMQLQSQNIFGDQQLHQDIECDNIVERHLRNNKFVRGFASEERPFYQPIKQHELQHPEEHPGFVVTYDPLDGSSIVDCNFAIGTIFSVWRSTEQNLIGMKIGEQVNAMIVIYGPRTTAIYYNEEQKKVQELTLIEDKWIISHDHLTIKPKSKIFSPGNLRSASDNEDYQKTIIGWIKKGYTLRYSGGMVPDVAQIFIKSQGIFSNVGSKNHKCKLRTLYEAAAVGFLVEKANGKTIGIGQKSLLEHTITEYDQRISFALGSSEEVENLAHHFLA